MSSNHENTKVRKYENAKKTRAEPIHEHYWSSVPFRHFVLSCFRDCLIRLVRFELALHVSLVRIV